MRHSSVIAFYLAKEKVSFEPMEPFNQKDKHSTGQVSSGGMLSDRIKSLHLHHANNGEAHMPEALQTLSAVVIDDAVVTDRLHRFQGDRSQLTTRNHSATFSVCLYSIFPLRDGLLRVLMI